MRRVFGLLLRRTPTLPFGIVAIALAGCGSRSDLLLDPSPAEVGGGAGGILGSGGRPPGSGGAAHGIGGTKTTSGGSGGLPACPSPPCTAPPDRVTSSNPDSGDRFGFSLAVSGDTLAVGASWEQSASSGTDGDPTDNSSNESGAVYVYVRRGASWIQEAYLKASNPDPGDWFGRRIALDQDTLVVGAYGEDSGTGDPSDNSTSDAGAAYVFVRRHGKWEQQAYLKNQTTSPTAWFGRRVAVAGDHIAIGAYGDDRFGPDAGSVAIFERTGDAWGQVAELFASNAGARDQFGSSVALSGDILVAAAFGEASGNGDPLDDSAPGAGAVYAFSLSDFRELAYVKAESPSARDWFGVSLALDDELLVVGAYGDDSLAPDPGTSGGSFARGSGAAHVFERKGSNFEHRDFLKAHNAELGDNFGASVALLGDRIVVGAFGEDSLNVSLDNRATNSGAAYLFEQRQKRFIETRLFKAPHTDPDDRFGWAVGATADFIFVGAFGDEAAPPSDGAVSEDAGSVYVFPW